MDTINLHIYPTTFKHESRILKETNSIIKLGLVSKILIVALWAEGLKEEDTITEHISLKRIKLNSSKYPKKIYFEIIKYFELMFRIVKMSRNSLVTVVNCHSLSVLPIGVAIKCFKKVKLIYDAHELETERNGLRGIRKIISKIMEAALMPFVDELIVVCQSIADWYQKRYKLKKVHVIRNIPFYKELNSFKSNILKEKFKIGENETLFLYHGILEKGRGLEILKDAFKSVESDKHLVIMGYGNLEDKIKSWALDYSNIHFHQAVGCEEVLKYASSADVGIALFQNTCLSYYYSLPNKLFEFLLSGIPVMVTDFPEMTAVIDEYDMGWRLHEDSEKIIKVINSISPEELLIKKENVKKNNKHYDWNNDALKYTEIYN